MYVYYWNDGSYATQGLLRFCYIHGYTEDRAVRVKLPKWLAHRPAACRALAPFIRHLARSA